VRKQQIVNRVGISTFGRRHCRRLLTCGRDDTQYHQGQSCSECSLLRTSLPRFGISTYIRHQRSASARWTNPDSSRGETIMKNLPLSETVVPPGNHAAVSVMQLCGKFVALAFGVSWLIWISAHRFGAGPGKGEEILAFGAAGPAVAAILLSRRGERVPTVNLAVRLLWFVLLWLLCSAVYVGSDKMRGVPTTFSARFGLIVALLAMIPAWIASGAFSANPGVRELLRTLVHPQNWRWQAVAFFSFPAILLVPTVILRLLGMRVISPQFSGTVWSFAAFGVFSLLRNFFFTAVLEEPGWRGFLLPRLQQKLSPLLASLVVWLPWALWHAPLDFTGGVGHTWMNYVQVRVIFFIPITIIMTWLYNRSAENILSTAIFHAGMNTFPFVLPYAPPALGLIFVWAGYAVIADKMWRRQKDAGAAAAST
jgi:membrane protease YdiL (CAAX protease family)